MIKATSITLLSLSLAACSTPGPLWPNKKLSKCIESCNNARWSCSNSEATAKTLCEENSTNEIERRSCSTKYHSRSGVKTCDGDESLCIENCEAADRDRPVFVDEVP